jgi:hypothetical protein
MRASVAIAIFSCSLLTQGCSQSCQLSGVPGRFTLSENGKAYELLLRPNGDAVLLVGNEQVGSVTWKLEVNDRERIELDAQDGSYRELRNLTTQSKSEEDANRWPSGLIAFPARCERDGSLKSIVVNPDAGIALNRVASIGM